MEARGWRRRQSRLRILKTLENELCRKSRGLAKKRAETEGEVPGSRLMSRLPSRVPLKQPTALPQLTHAPPSKANLGEFLAEMHVNSDVQQIRSSQEVKKCSIAWADASLGGSTGSITEIRGEPLSRRVGHHVQTGTVTIKQARRER